MIARQPSGLWVPPLPTISSSSSTLTPPPIHPATNLCVAAPTQGWSAGHTRHRQQRLGLCSYAPPQCCRERAERYGILSGCLFLQLILNLSAPAGGCLAGPGLGLSRCLGPELILSLRYVIIIISIIIVVVIVIIIVMVLISSISVLLLLLLLPYYYYYYCYCHCHYCHYRYYGTITVIIIIR